MANLPEHTSAYEEMFEDSDPVSGFIEVFQYEDGSITMAMENMTEQSVQTIIAALQEKLDQPNDPLTNIH